MTHAIEETLAHAMFLARHLSHCDYSTVLILILFELGFAPKNDGFTYLKKAIALRYENPTRQLKIDIYIEISVDIDGTEDNDRIEQAIRRTIADAWEECDKEVWSLLFPGMRKENVSKPTNGDLIARVAWFIELWQGCCKEVAYAER